MGRTLCVIVNHKILKHRAVTHDVPKLMGRCHKTKTFCNHEGEQSTSSIIYFPTHGLFVSMLYLNHDSIRLLICIHLSTYSVLNTVFVVHPSGPRNFMEITSTSSAIHLMNISQNLCNYFLNYTTFKETYIQ